MKKSIWLCFLLVCTFSFDIPAENLTIVTPYFGTEENSYINSDYKLHIKDSAVMKGLYLQSIDTSKYQCNLFLYRTDNINYSDIKGVNFIYDYYFGRKSNSKNMVGAGINYMKLDMAGTHVPTSLGDLDAFDCSMDTYSLYMRAGRYIGYDKGNIRWTLMPWIGGQMDISDGKGLVDYPGPGSAPFNIDSKDYYWITGLKVKAALHHFIQVEAKHTLTFNSEDSYNKTTVMVNVFMTKNIGFSYRYNRQETCSGKDIYNIFGIAAVF
ncbi:MAG TPA: hypothetical protein PKN36_06775 [bacterium]|nr:hypothetical protein [bacterium]